MAEEILVLSYVFNYVVFFGLKMTVYTLDTLDKIQTFQLKELILKNHFCTAFFLV